MHVIQVVARQEDVVHIKVAARGEAPMSYATATRCLLAHGKIVEARVRVDDDHEYVWYNGEWKGAWTVCVF